MPQTIQAAATLLVALLPGALYVWSFERQAGRYGISLSDRALRFVGGSSMFLAVFALPLYWLYTEYGRSIAQGRPLPMWLAVVPLVYVVVPSVAGTIIGHAVRRGWHWISFLTGPDPAPRAWDYLFQYDLDGWVRCRLKSGTWLGGAYAKANGRRSYAAGYPEPQDLFLAASVAVDSETGEFLVTDEGTLEVGSGGLLIRWEEVEYLEFIDA